MSEPPTKPVEHLPPALLLASTGGLLDAVVYLLHGHVFANAMTGNVVLMGIAALSHQPGQAARHLVPLAAFFAGVAASKALRNLPVAHSVFAGLILETIVLTIAGALPMSFPQMAFTAIVAFVSAFQVASFRRVQSFSYNSTFITGNLRDASEGLFDALRSRDPEARSKGRAKARDLGTICLCFFVGAMIGASASPRLGNHALWLAVPLLLIVILHVSLSKQPWPEPAKPKPEEPGSTCQSSG